MSPEAASPPPSPPPSVPPSSLPPPPQAASERAKTAPAATTVKRLEDRTKVSFRWDRHDAKVLLQAIGSVLPCQRKGTGGAQLLSINYKNARSMHFPCTRACVVRFLHGFYRSEAGGGSVHVGA